MSLLGGCVIGCGSLVLVIYRRIAHCPWGKPHGRGVICNLRLRVVNFEGRSARVCSEMGLSGRCCFHGKAIHWLYDRCNHIKQPSNCV